MFQLCPCHVPYFCPCLFFWSDQPQPLVFGRGQVEEQYVGTTFEMGVEVACKEPISFTTFDFILVMVVVLEFNVFFYGRWRVEVSLKMIGILRKRNLNIYTSFPPNFTPSTQPPSFPLNLKFWTVTRYDLLLLPPHTTISITMNKNIVSTILHCFL